MVHVAAEHIVHIGHGHTGRCARLTCGGERPAAALKPDLICAVISPDDVKATIIIHITDCDATLVGVARVGANERGRSERAVSAIEVDLMMRKCCPRPRFSAH